MKVILCTPPMCRKVLSRTDSAVQGNDFELIPTVRMESQHSIGAPTCHDFPRFVIISEKSWLEVGNRWRWSRFFLEKRPLKGKCSKKIFREDSPRHRITSCVQISWNLADRKSAKSFVVCLTKKLPQGLPLLLLRGSRPKSVRASSKQCTRSSPNFIQIRSLPAKL